MIYQALNGQAMGLRRWRLSKTQNIISELMVTLNFDYDIAKDMRKLYDYMNRRLIEANIKNDIDIISEVEELVTEFRDSAEKSRNKLLRG